MLRLADHNMISHFNAENASAFDKSLRRPHIGIRWLRIAARVVVHEHDAVRRTDDCRSKNFSRVGHRLAQRTDGDNLMSSNPLPHIQDQDRKTFAVRVEMRSRGDVILPVTHRMLRSVA